MTRPEDFEELLEFAMEHYGASIERAEVIVLNHAEEVRAHIHAIALAELAEEAKGAEKEKAAKEESGAPETAKPDTPA